MSIDGKGDFERENSGDVASRATADRWLDDALALYMKAEPRPGLEGRVLARVAVARRESSGEPWWWAALAFSMAAVLTVGLLWRWAGEPTQIPKNRLATIASPTAKKYGAESGRSANERKNHSPHSRSSSAGKREANRGFRVDALQAGAPPKLDQFPSPAPLSEQEQILMRYVARYPENAAVVAQALAEALQPDREAEATEAPSDNME